METKVRTLRKSESLRGIAYKVLSNGTVTYGDEIIATWIRKGPSDYLLTMEEKFRFKGRRYEFHPYDYTRMIDAVANEMEWINCYGWRMKNIE